MNPIISLTHIVRLIPHLSSWSTSTHPPTHPPYHPPYHPPTLPPPPTTHPLPICWFCHPLSLDRLITCRCVSRGPSQWARHGRHGARTTMGHQIRTERLVSTNFQSHIVSYPITSQNTLYHIHYHPSYYQRTPLNWDRIEKSVFWVILYFNRKQAL